MNKKQPLLTDTPGRALIVFALPMIIGNLFQQFYNMAANLVNLSIRVAVAQLCSPVWGIEFVWYAVPLGWGMNYIISYLWYRTGHWEKKTLVSSAH